MLPVSTEEKWSPLDTAFHPDLLTRLRRSTSLLKKSQKQQHKQQQLQKAQTHPQESSPKVQSCPMNQSSLESPVDFSSEEIAGDGSYPDDEKPEPVGECHSLYSLLDFSHQYYIPLMILLGLVGNLLSGLVFLSSQLRVRSSSYYLAALASADFGFLFSLLLVWLNNNLGWRVFNKDGWCESVVYASSVCSSLSVWLIVGFTVERFVAIQYPLHRPHMCTISRAKCIILTLLLLAMASHSYCFVTAGVVRTADGNEICEMKIQHLETMRIVNIIDTIASLMVPLVLIVVMNTMITRNLLRFGKRFGQPTASLGSSTVKTASARANTRTNNRASNNRNENDNDSTSSNKNAINLNRRPSSNNSNRENSIALNLIFTSRKQSSQESFKLKNNHPSFSRSQTSQQPQQMLFSSSKNIYQISEVTSQYIHVKSSSRNIVSVRNQQNITKMLLLISTVFILLNLPSYVIRLCVFFFTLARKETPALLWCLQQFFMLLYYTNFSINFLLYAMCGVTFRRCLVQLLRRILKSLKREHWNV